jgi:DNA-binding phage protein
MTVKLLPFDVASLLDSDEMISEYLSQVLEDGDSDELIAPWVILLKREAWLRWPRVPA